MNKIPQSTYTGYVWMSDSDTPQVYLSEPLSLDLDDNANPFVVEALLTDGATSYSIKYVDGVHHVNKCTLEDLRGVDYEEVVYVANAHIGHDVTHLCFKQYWRAEKDALCEGMEVLQPAELVFIGFKK